MLFLRNHKLDNRLLFENSSKRNSKKKKKPIIICHYLYALKYGNRSHKMYIRHCKQIAMTRQTQTYIYTDWSFFSPSRPFCWTTAKSCLVDHWHRTFFSSDQNKQATAFCGQQELFLDHAGRSDSFESPKRDHVLV